MRCAVLLWCCALATVAAIDDPEVISNSTTKAGSFANHKAIDTLKTWRFQIQADQVQDELATDTELSQLKHQIEDLEHQRMNVTVSHVTAFEAKKDEIERYLMITPIQREDASMIDEAAKLVLGHVADECSDNITGTMFQDAQTKLRWVDSLLDYVAEVYGNFYFNGKNGRYHSHNHAHVNLQTQQQSLVGLAQSDDSVDNEDDQILEGSPEALEELTLSLKALRQLYQEDVITWSVSYHETLRWCQEESTRVSNEMNNVSSILESIGEETTTLRAEQANFTLNEQSLNNATSVFDENIRLVKDQIDAKTTLYATRTQTRLARIDKLDSMRRMLLTMEAIVSELIANNGTLTSNFSISNASVGSASDTPSLTAGMSRDTSVRTCRQITGESGVYWVDLGMGPSEAFQAYCDMATQGGGWMLLTKNLTGFLASDKVNRNATVYPPWVSEHFDEDRHDKAYAFFASKPHQQWLKYIQVQARPKFATDVTNLTLITQAVMFDLGTNTSLNNVLARAAKIPKGACAEIARPISITTTRPTGTFDFPLIGSAAVEHVDYEAGSTQLLTRSGPAALTSSLAGTEICGMPIAQACSGRVICDTLGLLTLDKSSAPTAMEAGSVVANLLRSDCGALCDTPHAGTAEVIVFAARSDFCPFSSSGNTCSNNGICVDGVCECDYGFVGVTCQEKICPGGCGRGICSHGTCICEPGFTGLVCDTPIPCPRIKNSDTSIPHFEALDESPELSGTIECSGHDYLDTCLYRCDEGYRLREVGSVALKYWKAPRKSASRMGEACSGVPLSVSIVDVDTCSHALDNSLVTASRPINNHVTVQWFVPTDPMSGNCHGNGHHSINVTCGSTCVAVGQASEFGASNDDSDVYVSVSCRGAVSLSRQCLLPESPSNSTGIWTGSEPECFVAGCPYLPSPDHGSVVCSGTLESDVCHMFCNVGYNLTGSSAVVNSAAHCVSGVWTFDVNDVSDARDEWVELMCTKVDCGAPKRVNNGGYECDTTSFGSVCALSCEDGYVPRASAALELRCDANASWEGLDANACEMENV